MRSFVWIVSYPRSGNTFLRALLANYFSGEGRPLTLAELSASTIGEHDEALWTELTGLPAAERTVETEWRARLAYIRARRQRADARTRFFKSHTANGTAFGASAFEFAPGDRILHVVRHPGDVALSCADYWGLTLDETIDRLLEDGTVIDGRPKNGFEVLGSWVQHTRLWLETTAAPVLTVRYYDLVEETAETLRQVVSFLGEEADPSRIRAATAFSSFETLSAQEEITGFNEATQVRSGRFFRVGKALQWPDHLTPEQSNRVSAPAEAILDRLGFNALVAQRPSAVDG